MGNPGTGPNFGPKAEDYDYCKDHHTLEVRVIRIEESQKNLIDGMLDVKNVLKEVSEALNRLAVLEERFEDRHKISADALKRAFDTIEDVEKRVKNLEEKMPNLNLASGWVFKFALAIMGILGTAIVTLIGLMLKHLL